MPTTSTGTAYTLRQWTNAHGDVCQWGIADHLYDNPDPKPTLLYCHGAGASWNSFGNREAWGDLRSELIDDGWAFVESHAQGKNWGCDPACRSYAAALFELADEHPLGKVVVLGRSMGGLCAANLASQDRYGVKQHVAGLLFSAGVQSIVWWAITKGKRGPALWYGDPGADLQGFLDRSAPQDPLRLPPEWFSGMPVLWIAGTHDVAVAVEGNARPMYERVRDHAALPRLVVKGYGTHFPGGDASTFAMLDEHWTFLRRVIGAPVPVKRMRFVTTSGARPLRLAHVAEGARVQRHAGLAIQVPPVRQAVPLVDVVHARGHGSGLRRLRTGNEEKDT